MSDAGGLLRSLAGAQDNEHVSRGLLTIADKADAEVERLEKMLLAEMKLRTAYEERLKADGAIGEPVDPTAIYAAIADAVREATSHKTEYVGGFVLAKKLDELAGQR